MAKCAYIRLSSLPLHAKHTALLVARKFDRDTDGGRSAGPGPITHASIVNATSGYAACDTVRDV